MKKIDWKDLIISILVPVGLGFIVGLIIKDFNDFATLNKPFFAPPGIIFPIAWTIIYILMGISYYGVGNAKKSYTYEIQLFLNLMWSIIFFILKWRFIATLLIAVLIFLVVKMILEFYKIKKWTAYINIPYLIWLCYALVLSFSITILN